MFIIKYVYLLFKNQYIFISTSKTFISSQRWQAAKEIERGTDKS